MRNLIPLKYRTSVRKSKVNFSQNGYEKYSLTLQSIIVGLANTYLVHIKYKPTFFGERITNYAY